MEERREGPQVGECERGVGESSNKRNLINRKVTLINHSYTIETNGRVYGS